MGKKVWIVTSGVYSDYSVHAVCSTQKKADQVAELFRDANIPLEMEIDAFATKASKGLKLYLCWVKKSDSDIAPSQFPPDLASSDEVESKDGEALRLWVWAKNDAVAAKIANEKRSRWIAGADTYPRS